MIDRTVTLSDDEVTALNAVEHFRQHGAFNANIEKEIGIVLGLARRAPSGRVPTPTHPDTERLNFLVRKCGGFGYLQDLTGELGIGTQKHVSVRIDRQDDYGSEVYDGATVRDAIDKAMRETTQPDFIARDHAALFSGPAHEDTRHLEEKRA